MEDGGGEEVGEACAKNLPLALSDPSLVSNQDRQRVLDFPEPEMQSTNIAATTSLSKDALLQQAAHSRQLLMQAELNLLTHRYWIKRPGLRESGAQAKATNDLIARSQEYYEEITSRLNKMREPLYEEHEATAIENAAHEFYRQLQESLAKKPEDPEMAQARPWVRRLWNEIKDSRNKRWGYAVFQPPYQQVEDYLSRRDAVLFHAKYATSCSSDLSIRGLLQTLDRPSTLSSTEDAPLDATNREALRQQFKVVRGVGQSADGTADGLTDGILHNTFLVIDHESINSVMPWPGTRSPRFVDDMWVWAVDPDWTPDNEANEHPQYKGYMRVHIQQLVNNFFEQRRFQANQPLESLWEAAAVSKNQAFVSMDENEARLFRVGFDIGSALKP
ncbi:hypothetical protein F4678DRAFT_474435 [Xylaria arbuscula]|nr:hypothetical protein F4678DRAFT_474435 [Xylaria arbuscula]